MSNLGKLGLKTVKAVKELDGKTIKQKLLGERVGDVVRNVASSIPNNKLTRGIGTGLKVADHFVNRNPMTKLYNAGENLLINKGASLAQRHLNIDPTVAAMGLGFAIPGGPGNDAKAIRNAARLKVTGKLLKPKIIKGVKEWNITAKQMPQLKLQLEDWLRNQYSNTGKASKIKRSEFGTIVVDGDSRQISGITEFLERDGKLPFPPKVVTRKANAFKRLQNTRPPKEELQKLGKQLGLNQSQINTYIKEAQDGFGDVQEAARRQGLTFRQLGEEYVTGKKTPRTEYTPGAYHAGHFWPANKGGATSRRTAGIEPGKLNIQKKDSFEGTINLYAAQRAGIPTTWAEDMKMWFRDKHGLPGPNYAEDFNNAQRSVIESIPWHATEEQVEAIWKKNNLNKRHNLIEQKDRFMDANPLTTTGGDVIGGDRRGGTRRLSNHP